MKIFSPQDSNMASEKIAKKNGPQKKNKKQPVEKKAISENEIREKLASHVETSNTAKTKSLQKNSQQLGAGFLNSDILPPPPIPVAPKGNAKSEREESDSVKESHLLMSDVKLNDPKDSNTQEKLKTVLSTGAFNFNPREREALDKILNGN